MQGMELFGLLARLLSLVPPNYPALLHELSQDGGPPSQDN
jgi:hypothetical protein